MRMWGGFIQGMDEGTLCIFDTWMHQRHAYILEYRRDKLNIHFLPELVKQDVNARCW